MILDALIPEKYIKSPKSKRLLSFKKHSHKAIFLKTLSWRIIGTLDTMVISFVVTGSFSMAMGISGVELFSKMALYYFHERVWARITK